MECFAAHAGNDIRRPVTWGMVLIKNRRVGQHPFDRHALRTRLTLGIRAGYRRVERDRPSVGSGI
jgi:hypothetical protein